jgi:pantothenate kinase
MANEEILFRFVGPLDANGKPKEYLPGVPARDLTADDVERAKRRGLLDDIKKVSIYKAVSPEELAKRVAEREAAAKAAQEKAEKAAAEKAAKKAAKEAAEQQAAESTPNAQTADDRKEG